MQTYVKARVRSRSDPSKIYDLRLNLGTGRYACSCKRGVHRRRGETYCSHVQDALRLVAALRKLDNLPDASEVERYGYDYEEYVKDLKDTVRTLKGRITFIVPARKAA